MILWCWGGTGIVMKLWTINVLHYFQMFHAGPELASKNRSMTRLQNLRQTLSTKICVKSQKNQIQFRQVVYIEFDLGTVWMETFQFHPLCNNQRTHSTTLGGLDHFHRVLRKQHGARRTLFHRTSTALEWKVYSLNGLLLNADER